MRIRIIVFMYFLLFLLAGCGSGNDTVTVSSDGNTNGSDPVSVTLMSIAVTPANPTIALGTTQQFNAIGTFSDSSTKDITDSVTWSSCTASVVAMGNVAGSHGKAYSAGAGTATITAASGGITGSAVLTVIPAVLVSIAVTPANPSIALGTTQQFKATGTFMDNSTQDLTDSVAWSSSTISVAAMSNTDGSRGKAYSAGTGTTTITAASGGITGSTVLAVTPATLVSITVTPANSSIALGASQQFKATGTFLDSTTQDLTDSVSWSSSNASVAAISNAAGSRGKATSSGTGATTIFASTGNISGPAVLNVIQFVGPIVEFPVPTGNSSPFGITSGPDGNLWFTESNGTANRIGRITTAGVIIEFPIPTKNSSPSAITSGPDGNLWFTESNGIANNIGRITTAGAVTEFPIPTKSSNPSGITAGPDGNLWFTEMSGNKIGRITPSGVITEFRLPMGNSRPFGITSGPDGNLWFAEMSGNKIGRITPDGVISEFPIPTSNSNPQSGITAGPDGNIWFAEASGNKVGQITTAGIITEFSIPTKNSNPTGGITLGLDGNLWFAETGGNKIGRITTAGVITEFSIPTSNSNPFGITSGPDGGLWFTELNAYANKIGRIVY